MALSSGAHRRFTGCGAVSPPRPAIDKEATVNDTMTRRHRVRAAGSIGSALALAAAALAAAGPAAAINGGACNADYSPSIVPADFQDGNGDPNVIDNPWFPLIPGTVFTYDGVK